MYTRNVIDNAEPKRKRPKTEITRELFLYSGNQCAFPGCMKPLLNNQGSYVAEIAHIEGVGASSARHNKNLSTEDLRAVSNLMLMCPNHHVEIDDKKRVGEFTVEALLEMKAKHESKFRDAVAQMSAEIGDLTDLVPTYPTSLHAFGIEPEDEYHSEELSAVRSFVDVLANLPPAARQVLTVMVGQSAPHRAYGRTELRAAAIAVEKSVSNVDSDEYGQLLLLLQDRGLVDWQDDDGIAMLWLNGTAKENDSELDVLLELRAVFGKNSPALRRALVDLDFSIIDEAPTRESDE